MNSCRYLALMFLLGFGLTSFPSPSAMAGNPFKGEKLYAKHCAHCHGTKNRSVMAGIPDFSWRGMGSDGLMKSDKELVSRIRSGKKSCPSYAGILSTRDTLDIITHLRTLH